VLFLLTIVLFVLLRYTDFDYPFGIFKLVLTSLPEYVYSLLDLSILPFSMILLLDFVTIPTLRQCGIFLFLILI
jgi:hypothetical protein